MNYKKWLNDGANFALLLVIFTVVSSVAIHIGKLIWKLWVWNFNLW